MPRNRFVVPSVTTLTISDGDWIQVKNQLTVGEERAAFQQIIGEINQATGWRKPNIELQGLAEVAAYLVAWSLRDAQGEPIPPGIATLQLLDVESYKEIEAVIEGHIKKMEAERAALKKREGDRERNHTDFALCRVLRWSYGDLMDLPAHLYPELIEWLNETKPPTEFD